MTVTLALCLWPLVVVILFLRLPPGQALALSVVGGYLLLPHRGGINLPVLPSFNKDTIPVLTALAMVVLMRHRIEGTGPAPLRRRPEAAPKGPPQVLPGWLPASLLGRVLMAGIVAGAFLTVLTNGDRIVVGDRVLQGLRLYDGFSAVLNATMFLLPLVLARKFLARSEQHWTLLAVLAGAGLFYSLPSLWEIRMSPQLSRDIYGYFPHDWLQHMRSGGFRPVVFLQHGLWLGIFLAVATLAAAALVHRPGPVWRRILAAGAALWLLATLYLAKSLGAFLITIVLLPLVLVALAPRIRFLLTGALAATLLLYPMLRGADLVPTGQVLSVAERIHPGRALSLQFRLDNEDLLLARANDRPLFGWGGYGRNRVYGERGNDMTTTDGGWIIVIGAGGWVRYISQFGLLLLPVIVLAFRSRKDPPPLSTSLLGVVLVANVVDLIPNDGLTPITWLMAGAILGRLEIASEANRETEAEAEAAPGRPGRSRGIRPVRARPDPAPALASAAPPGEDRPRSPYTRQSHLHRRS